MKRKATTPQQVIEYLADDKISLASMARELKMDYGHMIRLIKSIPFEAVLARGKAKREVIRAYLKKHGIEIKY